MFIAALEDYNYELPFGNFHSELEIIVEAAG
jgi:hypothetical protein